MYFRHIKIKIETRNYILSKIMWLTSGEKIYEHF